MYDGNGLSINLKHTEVITEDFDYKSWASIVRNEQIERDGRIIFVYKKDGVQCSIYDDPSDNMSVHVKGRKQKYVGRQLVSQVVADVVDSFFDKMTGTGARNALNSYKMGQFVCKGFAFIEALENKWVSAEVSLIFTLGKEIWQYKTHNMLAFKAMFKIFSLLRVL
jgi:hypothetical protein